jgi:hypothetical protein
LLSHFHEHFFYGVVILSRAFHVVHLIVLSKTMAFLICNIPPYIINICTTNRTCWPPAVGRYGGVRTSLFTLASFMHLREIACLMHHIRAGRRLFLRNTLGSFPSIFNCLPLIINSVQCPILAN